MNSKRLMQLVTLLACPTLILAGATVAPAQASTWPGPDPAANERLAATYVPGVDDYIPSIDDVLDDLAADRKPADAETGPCAGKPNFERFKSYSSTIGSIPLRCGRYDNGRGFGYRKMVARGRWNTWYDGMIGATLQKPDRVEREGTTVVMLSQYFAECTPPYRFKVVIQTANSKGIITAYADATEGP